MFSRLAILCVATAVGLTGCQRAGESSSDANSDDIAWFQGGIDQAFAEAAAQHRLVFLYWGAAWCPPCHDLKAHVFSRRDFREKLRQFVPVYLDGDAPGAQLAGEQFHVMGYPTVLILNADRREIARIAGGGDLARYADVLDLALESVRPLSDLLAALQADHGLALDQADCRRLAWNGWDLDPREQPAQLSATLQLAAARCPAASVAERDRLILTAADLAAGAERTAIESGKPASARLTNLLDTVDALLASRHRALRSGDAVLSLDEDYFVAVRMVRPAQVNALRVHWFALMDAMEKDSHYGDGTRLYSAAARLLAAKSLAADGTIPVAVASRARAALDAYLARDYDPDTRAGVVNSAEWVLTYLDDKARMRALLGTEIETSKTPYYYMADLADLDEQEGKKEQALELLERAYRESNGPATRFQWGAQYAAGLLRISPQDEPRIRSAMLEVLGELAGPDRIHARARARLDKLSASFSQWARDTHHATTLAAVAQRWQEICAALPVSDPVRTECPKLVGAAAG